MRVSRFYTEQVLTSGQEILLDDNLSHYMLRVLRLRSGDRMLLFRGDGKEYSATLLAAEKKQVLVSINGCKQPKRESPLHIRLGQGVSRTERMDFVLQKSVELGVNAITPLWTRRARVQLKGARLEKRQHHWQGVLRSACEQSGRVFLPELGDSTTLESWCASTRDSTLKLALDPQATTCLGELPASRHISILVGPEGGLDGGEISLAVSHGFQTVNIGPRILRTETAALTVLAALQVLWGDLGLPGKDKRSAGG